MVVLSSPRALASLLLLTAIPVTVLFLPFTNAQNATDTISKDPLGVRAFIEKAMAANGVPGMSVAIFHKDRIIFSEGFGKRNNKDPFQVDTLAPIGSITKSFTAASVGELVAEGKMDWDTTPISKYLPEFQAQDPVVDSQLTAIEMLSHRTNYLSYDLSWIRTNTTRRELIKRLKNAVVDRKMRTRLQYNNVIYSVIGEAAANVAKTSWEKLVDSKVVKPLGLKNTGYGQMGMRRQSNNHALAHFAYSFDDLINGKIEIKDLDPIYMARAPAGDMFSNVLDLIRWGQVIMNSGQLNGKQVLSKESIERMVTGHTYAPNPDPDFAPTRAYGLGMGISSYKGKTFFSHSGGVSGFQANLLIFPNDKVIIASLSNILPSTPATYLPYYIADHLFGLPTTKDWLAESVRENKLYYEFVQDELKGASLPPQIRDKPPTRPLIDFAGTYENPIHGSITIRLESEGGKGESLFFNINQFDSKMDHYHYDSFKFILNDDGIVISTLLTFQTNADGNISFQVNFPEGLCQFEKANL